MLDKLINLWNTNKWLFFLLLPLVIGAFILKIYLEYNQFQAEKELKNAENTDNKLKNEQEKLNKEAENHKNEADSAANRIKDRNENNVVDLDWHKKLK